MFVWLSWKTIKFYTTKLVRIIQWLPSYILDEKSQLVEEMASWLNDRAPSYESQTFRFRPAAALHRNSDDVEFGRFVGWLGGRRRRRRKKWQRRGRRFGGEKLRITFPVRLRAVVDGSGLWSRLRRRFVVQWTVGGFRSGTNPLINQFCSKL